MKDSPRTSPSFAAPAISQALFDDVRIVMCFGATTDEDLDAHIREALVMEPRVRVVLVVGNDKAGLDAKARARLRDSGLVAKRTAVLMDSILARGVVTALHWMGGNVRGFRPDQLDQACDFLQVPRDRWAALGERVTSLRERGRVPTAPQRTEPTSANRASRVESQQAIRAAKIRPQTGGRDP